MYDYLRVYFSYQGHIILNTCEETIVARELDLCWIIVTTKKATISVLWFRVFPIYDLQLLREQDRYFAPLMTWWLRPNKSLAKLKWFACLEMDWTIWRLTWYMCLVLIEISQTAKRYSHTLSCLKSWFWTKFCFTTRRESFQWSSENVMLANILLWQWC